MSASIEPPEEARWALALDGIRRLEGKIDTLAHAQQSLQDQQIDLRQAYTRTAPLFTVGVLEADLRRQLASLDGRLSSLEGGTLSAVLERMREDAVQRQIRQAAQDRQTRWRLVGQGLVALALIALIAVVLGVGWGG